MVLSDLLHERLEQPDSDGVGTLVVVAVAREVAFDLVVDDQTAIVADRLNLGVLDSAEGIYNVGEARDTCREGAAGVGVDESHLSRLVVVLVVHIVNEIEGVDMRFARAPKNWISLPV